MTTEPANAVRVFARAMWRKLRPIGHQSLNLVFPPQCLLCRGHVAGKLLFCDACDGKVRLERTEESCPRCGSSVAPYEVSQGRCKRCRRRRFAFSGVARAGPYADALGSLFRSYKYEGREELGGRFADWLISSVLAAPWLDRIQAVVTVPTHWRHRLFREHYPAEVLAGAVSRAIQRPMVSVLRRVRAGPHQIGLGYRERVRNVRGAFAMRPGVTLNKPLVLLVDDVKTTGATLNECAGVLRRAGAKEVFAAVVLAVSWNGPLHARLPV
jgi:ComF family protein